MKSLTFFLFSVFVGLVTSCDLPTTETFAIADDSLSENKLVIEVDHQSQVKLTKEQSRAFGKYIIKQLDQPLDFPTEATFLGGKTGDVKQLIFKVGSSSTQHPIPFAFVFRSKGNDNGDWAIHEIHSCYQTDCGCCDFKTDDNSEIQGCKCTEAKRKGDDCSTKVQTTCNHFIGTGSI